MGQGGCVCDYGERGMVVDASSFRTNGVAELEVLFHENMRDLPTLLALEAESRSPFNAAGAGIARQGPAAGRVS